MHPQNIWVIFPRRAVYAVISPSNWHQTERKKEGHDVSFSYSQVLFSAHARKILEHLTGSFVFIYLLERKGKREKRKRSPTVSPFGFFLHLCVCCIHPTNRLPFSAGFLHLGNNPPFYRDDPGLPGKLRQNYPGK